MKSASRVLLRRWKSSAFTTNIQNDEIKQVISMRDINQSSIYIPAVNNALLKILHNTPFKSEKYFILHHFKALFLLRAREIKNPFNNWINLCNEFGLLPDFFFIIKIYILRVLNIDSTSKNWYKLFYLYRYLSRHY